MMKGWVRDYVEYYVRNSKFTVATQSVRPRGPAQRNSEKDCFDVLSHGGQDVVA